MTLCAMPNISRLCCHRIVYASHRFAAARPVCCPLLRPGRSLTVSAVSRYRTVTDAENSEVVDNSEVDKKRTTRWLPRNKKVRVKRDQHVVEEPRRPNDPSVSVLVDMLASRESDNSEQHSAELDVVRAEIDEKLKELDEVANIRIQDIHLAMEMEDEETEKTEVHIHRAIVAVNTAAQRLCNLLKWAMVKRQNCRMRNEKCGMTVIGLQVRPCDHSYYAVYRVLLAQQ